jgi:hypothetical protein
VVPAIVAHAFAYLVVALMVGAVVHQLEPRTRRR